MDEKRVIKIIRRVMPAVVSIAISKSVEDLEKEIPAGLMGAVTLHTNGKKLKQEANSKKNAVAALKEMADAHGMVEVGGGSGCIVDSNGLILTNKHVVSDGLAAYSVILNDGRRFAAEILSRDPVNDVAILKINATRLPSLDLGDATRLELGQSVVAIGNALGMFKNTVSLGIVSGLSRAITAQAEPDAPPQELRGLIQTDAAINPGNSGGPLVDHDGRVVGVNAAIISGAQSVGFAVPINAARRDIEDIKKFGRIRRPLLGLRYIMIDDKLQEKMKLSVNYGALVTNEGPRDPGVIVGSPAALAGIREKDILLTLDGKKLDREHPIQDFLEDRIVGNVVNLIVLRDEKELNISVTLTERK